MSGSGERAGETVAREGGDAPRLDSHAFLAQQMAKTPIRRLMRIAWDSVGDIVQRVVADHLSETRFYGLVLIGVDEIAYRRGQRYPVGIVSRRRSGSVKSRRDPRAEPRS